MKNVASSRLASSRLGAAQLSSAGWPTMCICLSGSLASLLPPPPLPVWTLSKKFAIDHHSSLNCFANCFQQYSPSPSLPCSSSSHCLCFPSSFFSLRFFSCACWQAASCRLSRCTPPPAPARSTLSSASHTPWQNKGQRRQRRFLLRCQNLMNFFFIHLGLSHSASEAPTPTRPPPLLLLKLCLAISFYLFYFLRFFRNLLDPLLVVVVAPVVSYNIFLISQRPRQPPPFCCPPPVYYAHSNAGPWLRRLYPGERTGGWEYD